MISVEETDLSLEANIDGQEYLDGDWQDNFDRKSDAVEYFQHLNLYAELLKISEDQKEEFIHTKAYDELTPEDIEDWVNHFGSMHDAVNYAENKLRNNGIEKGRKVNWDLRVETAIEWAIDGRYSQRAPENYSNILFETLEEGFGDLRAYETDNPDIKFLWDGPVEEPEI